MIVKTHITPDELEYIIRMLISILEEKNRMHLN